MRRLFFVAVTAIVLVSCGKEGPQGPRGPQGRNGQDGRDGTQINTYYFDVYPNEWRTDGNYGFSGYYCFAEKNVGELTSAVIDHGAVLVYVIFGNFDNQLPFVEPLYDNGGYTRIIRYDLQQGKIGFIVADTDFKTLCPPYSNVVQFKVVIISKI